MRQQLVAYRHIHEESNVAAVLTVVLAEFGLAPFDPESRGQELVLHGLLQRGRFLEGRGHLVARALRYLFDRGLAYQVLHDATRTAALRERLIAERPEFDFQLLADIGNPQSRPFSPQLDVPESGAAILVESKHAAGRLPLHLLLVRRVDGLFQVMNSDTGENHVCTLEQISIHLSTPVGFGAGAFAGGLYSFTGLAIRLN
jgi:hypothetical protein